MGMVLRALHLDGDGFSFLGTQIGGNVRNLYDLCGKILKKYIDTIVTLSAVEGYWKTKWDLFFGTRIGEM